MNNHDSNILINELLKCNCNGCMHFNRDIQKFKEAKYKDQFFGKCATKGTDLVIDPLAWMDDVNGDCYTHRRTGINYGRDGFPPD